MPPKYIKIINIFREWREKRDRIRERNRREKETGERKGEQDRERREREIIGKGKRKGRLLTPSSRPAIWPKGRRLPRPKGERE